MLEPTGQHETRGAAEAASLAVVLVDHNGLPDTRDCLRSLARGSKAPLRILVVNTGHAEACGPLAREFPQVELLQAGGNVGFGAANNLALERLLRSQPRPEFVLLLNNDCVVEPDAIARLAGHLAGHAEVAAVAPRILLREDNGRLWAAGGGHVAWRAFSYNRGQDERDDGRWDAPGEMTFLSACAFLARLSAFERGGMFDPDFFLYGEDAELCARWQRAGLRLFYLPAARVLHRGSVAAGDEYAPLQAYLRYRNRLLLARKTLGAGGWLRFLLVALPLLVARDCVRQLRAGRGAAFRASLGGLSAYFRGERGRPAMVPEHPARPAWVVASPRSARAPTG